MARVAVIVTSYQHARFLPATLESLCAQRFADWQAVVVDDGSADESHAVARAFAAREPRIRALSKRNGGTGDARNVGFAASDPAAEFVAVLDGDDLWAPDFLATLVPLLEAQPAAAAAMCGFRLIDAEGRDLGEARRSRFVPGPLGLPRDLGRQPGETPFVAFYCATGQGPFALFRRRHYLQTRGWTTSFCPHEDTDFLCQLALKGPVLYCPAPLYLKRLHARQITAGGHARSPHVPPDAYHRFRRRWCAWPPADPREAALLAAAHRHYMRWHRPLRDLRVAARALGQFLRGRGRRHLAWCGELTARALADLGRYHLLRRRPDRAQDLARFPLAGGGA